jgi:hypothetical protein
MTRKDKLQHLLISHLLEEGHVTLKLPDGMVLEVGILKEGRDGDLHKIDNYCWLIASQKDREVSIDSYNLGLKFSDDTSKIIFEDAVEEDGCNVRTFSVV